ncbi:MAG TPA: hypothetical protein K8W20_26535 [Pseudomonas lactis]|uniref:Tip attachment protein J central straight fiber domain-containing protein n=1 Tax=Pseudomonas lactis TaxID=1615674 RepID=A0A921TBL4_9PSED|nr:hypothetical protein [Pseudomonas lactis]HJH22245.1 hypothetical protein [Pseudomonas lactis]
MSDPQFNALAGQVSAISAQIQSEQCARMVADEALASRVTASEAAIAAVKLQVDIEASNKFGENILLDRRLGAIEKAQVEHIQSNNFVPGVSGWKLNHDGSFEINSCVLGDAAKAPDRQTVSVEVASWSKYDLPKNAANLLQFMEAELQKVPEEYRHTAEFEEFDASFGDESFNARLFLSYSRLETEEELAERLEKAKVAGTRIRIKNGAISVSHDGVLRYRFGNLDAPEQPQPFKVDEGKTYINDTFLHDGAITSAKIGPSWSLKMQEGVNGLCAAGVGLGLIVDPARFSLTKNGQTEIEKAITDGDASKILELLAGKIDETELGKQLKDRIDAIDAIGAGQVNKRLDELKEKQGAENRAVADRLDCLATKLGELHALIGQARDSAATQAKREVADALLRDLEADKSGGTISDFIRGFGGAPMPFSGYTGDIPLKR